MQVFHLGRGPRTKETLPDFLKWHRVTRPPLVFRGLTGNQRTPGFWGVTESVFKIRSFLRLAGYHRRFIEDFSRLAAPMTRLTWKEVKFDWDDRCEEAFQELKRRLTSTPILIVPDRGQGYIVYCDASSTGLGCVLIQSERVVAYGSC